MAQFQINSLSVAKRTQYIDQFYDSMSLIKNREEARSVFRDLLTPNEIAMLIRRIQTAILLQSGKTHREVVDIMRSGNGKVNEVQKSLNRNGIGYQLLYERLKQLEKRRKNSQRETAKKSGGQLHPGLFMFESLFQ